MTDAAGPAVDQDGTYRFTATLFRWEGDAAWHFVAVPEAVADDVEFRAEAAGVTRGFGSVKVHVTVGATTWSTSLFPDKGRGTYVLPVKKAVRTAAGAEAGDAMTFTLTLVEA